MEVAAVRAHELGRIRVDHEHRRQVGAPRGGGTETESIAVGVPAQKIDSAQAAEPDVVGWSGAGWRRAFARARPTTSS